MGDSPTTRPSLLVRIRDCHNDQAWTEFVEMYAPLVYGYLRRRGLQDADAADVTQEVLGAVAGAVKRLDYDPQRGSFRGWLFTVVNNKLRNLAANNRRPGGGGGKTGVQGLLEDQPDRSEKQDSQWNELYEQRLFTLAAEHVRSRVEASTWQAFWQTAVEAKRAKQVAEQLEMSVASVYLAKGRVMTRLKERVRYLRNG